MLTRSVDEGLDVADVLFVGDELDAVQVLAVYVVDLPQDALDHLGRDVLCVLKGSGGLVASQLGTGRGLLTLDMSSVVWVSPGSNQRVGQLKWRMWVKAKRNGGPRSDYAGLKLNSPNLKIKQQK